MLTNYSSDTPDTFEDEVREAGKDYGHIAFYEDLQIELPFESLSMEQLIVAYRQQLQMVKDTAELIDELVEEHDADVEVLRQISVRIQKERLNALNRPTDGDSL